MAALKHNGMEVARLQKTIEADDGVGQYQYTYSVRDTGWILKKGLWVRPDGTRSSGHWVRWRRYKPFDVKSTQTLAMRVRHLIDNMAYEFVTGSMSDVVAAQDALVRKVKS